jgi:hypothetical protein
MAQPPKERLDSWKEIAAHLQHDERTAQRWEKENGLPVHRFPGKGRHAVFAYRTEIDAWLASAGTAPPSPAAPQTAAMPSPSPGWPARIPRLVQAGLIAALAIGLFAAASFLWKAVTAGPLASIALRENKFVALDKAGRTLWTYPLPEGSPALPPGRTPGITYVGDLDSDGRNEVLVSAPYPVPLSASEKEYERQLYCFSETGKLLWSFDPQGTITFGSGDYGPPWIIQRWLLYRAGGETRIALVVTHHVWWPSALVILDARGRELARYVNSGDILSLASMETPSGPLLLAGGVSNANGPSGFLAVLDGKDPSGNSPEKPGSEFECKSCPPGHPLHYFVFPRSEVNVLALSPFNQVYSTRPLQAVVEVSTHESNFADIGAMAIFEFTPDFHLMKARWSDGYPQLHGEFERQGKIKHTWQQCPDRFGPRLVHSWDPQHGWTDLHPNRAAK